LVVKIGVATLSFACLLFSAHQMTVGGKLIKDFTGASNSIMPGQRRRFTFEWPKAVTEREIKFSY
jgi:hypothetical protein